MPTFNGSYCNAHSSFGFTITFVITNCCRCYCSNVGKLSVHFVFQQHL